jgi:AcrR family transcriptional regulator
MGGLLSPETDPAVEDAHRRGRILWALAASMAEKGYPSTTISDIARIARVSKTIVYAHFRDKEQCLLELYSRATERVLEILRTAQTDATARGLDWRSRLRAVIEAYFAALADGPAVAWAALVEVQAAGPSALARRREVLERYVDLLADTAGELLTTHPDEVRAVDRRLMVAAVGGINELMLARVERGDVEHLTEDAGVAADVVIGLLERRG